MFKCIHGWTCKLLVSPVVGNLPKILSAGGGWGRINPHQWHPPTPCPDPPSLTFTPTGPPVWPHPQFRAQFLNFPISLVEQFPIKLYPSLCVMGECHLCRRLTIETISFFFYDGKEKKSFQDIEMTQSSERTKTESFSLPKVSASSSLFLK